MTKKQKKTKKKPGKGRKTMAKSPRLVWPPAASSIRIELGMPQDPGPIKCRPSSQVAFLVLNDDDEPCSVWIDPAKIIERGEPTRLKHRNPFEPSNQRITVEPRAVGLIRYQLRPVKYFFPTGATSDPVGFKYTIECETAGGAVSVLDPDLDVTDPRAAGSG